MINYQVVIGKELQAKLDSFKKDGSSHKTENYVRSRHTAVYSLWVQFQTNDVEIAASKDDYKATQYYKRNYFKDIETVAIDLLARLKKTGTELKLELECSPKDVSNYMKQWCSDNNIGASPTETSISAPNDGNEAYGTPRKDTENQGTGAADDMVATASSHNARSSQTTPRPQTSTNTHPGPQAEKVVRPPSLDSNRPTPQVEKWLKQ